ncbi:MAG: acyl-CoA dehydrogenase [Lautropia sp.]
MSATEVSAPMAGPVIAASALDGILRETEALQPAARLAALIAAGADSLPLPGKGATARRWALLCRVARADLSLAKLFEGHTDALAILAELGAPRLPDGGSWGVWAAEAPDGRLEIVDGSDVEVVLHGRKCWCSGAGHLSQALTTAWRPGEAVPQLVAVRLRESGIRISDAAWHAVGMQQSESLDVTFENVPALAVGEPGAYLSRSGFWHGGAGVAACWYGGAVHLAEALRRGCAGPRSPDPFRLAAVGASDVALRSARATLHEAAAWIDHRPRADARVIALRARLAVEAAVEVVVARAGRALGAGPYCRDARFARMVADLPVFVRQSHGERDLATLGEAVIGSEVDWTL